MPNLDGYLDQNASRFEDDLCELLRIPSVSADTARRGDVDRAADWVLGQFTSLGLHAEKIPTAGNPLIYAESPPVPDMPVALVYGHYDVQPVDPLSEWLSPPFEPTRRNGNIYARGATDDKGQMLTHIKGAEAWLKTTGRLPIQVKFLIEGEEEVGSVNLDSFIAAHKERLACDVVVVSDSSQFAPGQPAITYGLRGLTYFELRLTGPKQDLHSGTFGGGVTNPANTLCRMMAALLDSDGRVQVPGFYDAVVPLADVERRQFRDLPFDEAAFAHQLGIAGLTGEAGYSTLERRWARPTCDINGMTSGYQGEGAKTILPARARPRNSAFGWFPIKIRSESSASLERMLRAMVPPGIKIELINMGGSPGIVVPLESPFISAAVEAIGQAFKEKPVFIREGGSIPVVGTFHDQLGVDTLLLGWGLDDDNTHSPNEKFNLADYHRGIRASAYLWSELAKTRGECPLAKEAGLGLS